MADKLTSFLTRHNACIDVLARLAATGAATPEETFERADDRDLVWAVTRPGVMSADQRRRFLSEAVLAPIEHLLTDELSEVLSNFMMKHGGYIMQAVDFRCVREEK